MLTFLSRDFDVPKSRLVRRIYVGLFPDRADPVRAGPDHTPDKKGTTKSR